MKKWVSKRVLGRPSGSRGVIQFERGMREEISGTRECLRWRERKAVGSARTWRVGI